MTIRPIRPEDTESAVEMGARMHAEGAYAFLPYDLDKVRRLVADIIADTDSRCGLVAEDRGQPVAMLGGYVSDYFFCDEKVASDLVLFVDKAYRGSTAALRLVKGFRRWATDHGAVEICLGVSTNVDAERTGKFYERIGLGRAGAIYKRRLP